MSNEELFVATSVKNWSIVIDRLEKAVSAFSDNDLQLEVSPGRNRVYYLVGHLAALHDRMFPLLGLGERLQAELDGPFVNLPDRASVDISPAADLRRFMFEIHARIREGLGAMSPEDFLRRHADVSEADFQKDPTRNRLAVLQNRTAHAAFHTGQIRLALKK